MYFSQLLTLSEYISEERLKKVDAYFASLSNIARQNITVSKVADAIQCDYQVAAAFVQKCIEIKFLEKHFALRCPECQTPIAEIDSLPVLYNVSMFCPKCERDIENDEINFETDIMLFFSISNDKFPFVAGQPNNSLVLNASERAAVQSDTFLQGVQYKLITYDDLFDCSTEPYAGLFDLIHRVKGTHQTTTSQGDALELLICKLFSLCILFRVTTKQRSETNQIDVMVRIMGNVSSYLFQRMGGCFYLECKNEKDRPSVDYLLKLRSILRDAGMKLGILISRVSEPKTFAENANHIFLKDNIVIIRICLDELETLVKNHINLLELLEKKIVEVETAAQKSLGQDGLQLYNA